MAPPGMAGDAIVGETACGGAADASGETIGWDMILAAGGGTLGGMLEVGGAWIQAACLSTAPVAFWAAKSGNRPPSDTFNRLYGTIGSPR